MSKILISVNSAIVKIHQMTQRGKDKKIEKVDERGKDKEIKAGNMQEYHCQTEEGKI